MIDINLLIAVGGIAITLIFSILSQNRASRNSVKDEIEKAKAEAKKQARVESKLDEISSDTKDIKSDLRNVKSDISSINERLIIVEQSTKSAHKRIDNIQKGDTDEAD
jgi:septal ring factor EnvC (AmiA/AmiB activator)